MTTIWGSMDREIRFVLKVPEDHKNLADFIKRVEQTKYFIIFFVKDPAPNRTPYTSYGHESYPFRSAYIKRFYNSQPFQQRNNKTHDIHFLFYIHRKDVDDKNKNIDRTN